MIVRNEAGHLAQCLAGIRDLADEIIVVDTGSRDDSREIAKSYGAKVYDFQWRDDFAAARNYSLEQATGNWILIIDADERISRQDLEKLKTLIAKSAAQPSAYKLLTRNYTNQHNLIGWQANPGDYPEEEKGSGWIPSIKVRLWSNHPRIRFSYPVHELVEPSLKQLGIEPQLLPVVIHHYGKLDHNASQEKGKRYFQIGWQKLEKMDANAKIPLRELAVQAGTLERFREAAELWRRLLRLDPDNGEALLNLGTALFAIGNTKEALKICKKAVRIYPQLKELQFNQALYELHLGQAAAADERLRRLLEKHPDYPAARFLQAAASACRKGGDRGHQDFQRLQEQNRNFSPEIIRIAGDELVRTLTRAGRDDYAETIKRATTER